MSKPKVEIIEPVATKTKPTTPSNSVPTQLLVGDWFGNEATELTRYYDFSFKPDGSGSRNGTPFQWSLIEKQLNIKWFRIISKSEYNSIRSNADAMNYDTDGTRVFQTGNKTQRIISKDGQYMIVNNSDTYTVKTLSATKLVISIKTKNGKIMSSHHTRM